MTTDIKENFLVFQQEIAENDYYEKNPHAGSLYSVPIYFFDLNVTKLERFTIKYESANQCLKMNKILVLAPNGRVISSKKNKNEISFNAQLVGKYVIKSWITHTCNGSGIYNFFKTRNDLTDNPKNLFSEDIKKSALATHTAIFNIKIWANDTNSISNLNTGIRVYSKLGVSKEGSLFKGEQLKERCLERFVPTKNMNGQTANTKN